MSLIKELKRRNVVRVGVAYVVAAWLIAQVTELALDSFAAPDWVMKTVLFLLLIGFPMALVLAWAFELTPEGIKLEKDVDRSESITPKTGQKLDRMIIVVLLIAVAVLLTDRFVLQQGGQEAVGVDQSVEPIAEQVTEKSVAVLPFRAMSNGPDDEYFADGLTEEILNSLTQLPELLVTARTSAFYFKDKDLPIQEIASTLGVAHVVEGSVRRDRERLRIAAQLIRAADGFHLWSSTYDRTVEDSFAVQTDIAENVAAALNVVLDDDRRAEMRAAGVRDPQAFIAYQKGIELYDLAHGGKQLLTILAQANTYFEEAVDRVPNFSDAYLLQTDYYTHLLLDIAAGRKIDGVFDGDIVAARTTLQAHLDAAVRHARDDTRRVIAEYDRSLVTGDWRGLPVLLDRALDAPGCIFINWPDAGALPFGSAAAALLFHRRQIDCDPFAFESRESELEALIWLGEFDAAVEAALVGLQTVPSDGLRYLKTMALTAAGKYVEAEAVIEHELRDEMLALQSRIELAASRGDDDSGRKLLETYRRTYGIAGGDIIMYEALLGDRDAANRIAAEVDARAVGHMVLLLNTRNCFCGAPFDLEVTPNFARMLEDAALPWPPTSPIEWPLKTW